MKTAVRIALLVLFLAASPSAFAILSGDPTVRLALEPSLVTYGPNTPMNGAPLRLERDPAPGTVVAIWFCYYDPLPSCTTTAWCPPCADYAPGKKIDLDEWCRRLDALPMPLPAKPTDQRPVCEPQWRRQP